MAEYETEIFLAFMSTVKSSTAGGWEAALFRDVELVDFSDYFREF